MKKINKKILILFYRPPFPIRKGDQVILQKRLKAFSLIGNTTLLTYGNKLSKDEIKELEKYCKNFYFVKFSFIRSLIGLLKNIFTQIPFQVALYENNQFKKTMINLLRKQFDYIHFVGLRSTYYHELIDNKSIDFIDSMYFNFSKRLKNKDNFFGLQNIIYKLEIKRLFSYENNLSSIFKKSFVISSRDQRYIKNSIVLHGSVDHQFFSPIEKDFSWILCFTGNLNYIFNEEALVWFYDIFEFLSERYPLLKFHIIGSGNPTILKKYIQLPSVKIINNPKNMASEINKTDIYVCPLQSATGMQNKILEAMACGKPIVMTHVSIGDLKIKNSVNALVANVKEDFIEKIELLILNKKSRVALGNKARELILNHYSDNQNMINFLNKLGLSKTD